MGKTLIVIAGMLVVYVVSTVLSLAVLEFFDLTGRSGAIVGIILGILFLLNGSALLIAALRRWLPEPRKRRIWEEDYDDD